MTTAPFESEFEVSLSSGEDGPVIEVGGELDSGTCDELLSAFRSLNVGPGTAMITLDLRRVSFVDSAGTRAVIMIEREAREQGCLFAISAPPPEVTELLRTAGVIGRFQFQPAGGLPATDSSAVLERLELELPLDPQSPARARVELRELLADHDPIQRGGAVLLASEIVTNAVVHPTSPFAGPIGLRIFTYEDGIRVEVDDGGEGFDPTVPSQPAPERGRGLYLVDRFASRWGTERLADDRGPRFMVWFELDWRQPRNLPPTPSD